MPLKIVCSSCGFVFYEGKDPKSVDNVLKKWDYRCPCCLSKLELKIQKWEIEVLRPLFENGQPE